jgi:sialic acid synthase SpsE
MSLLKTATKKGKRMVEVIGEVGSNYNGDLEIARNYVTQLKTAGADVVKFQTIKRDLLVSEYINVGGVIKFNPLFSKFANLELPKEWHFELNEFAVSVGIEFMSSPFFLEAVDWLTEVGVKRFKVASGDISFFPLLRAIGETKKPVLLSTGASSLIDIENAVKELSRAGSDELTLLHCVSNYPPTWEEINLRAIETLKDRFGFPVGLSDHSPGDVVALGAVALGAVVVEKHVTFDRSLDGPDHQFAMQFEEFSDMIEKIRLLEKSLGSRVKEPSKQELINQGRMRRGRYKMSTGDSDSLGKELWLRPEDGSG